MQKEKSYPTLGSKEVTRLIMVMHEVAASREQAFLGRITNFNRLGFPKGLSFGRGNPLRYDANQLFQILAAFELAQFDVEAQRAVKLIEECWPRVRYVVRLAYDRMAGGTCDHHPVFWKIPSDALYPFFVSYRGKDVVDENDIIKVITQDEVNYIINEDNSNQYRFCFFRSDRWASTLIRVMMGEGIVPSEKMRDFIYSIPAG